MSPFIFLKYYIRSNKICQVNYMINLVRVIKTQLGKVSTYDIDGPGDLESIPEDVAMGSIANSIEEGISYVKDSTGVWRKMETFVNYCEVL